MKLIEFLAFVVSASALLAGLGILLATLALCVGARQTETVKRDEESQETFVLGVRHKIATASLRVVSAQIAAGVVAAILFIGMTTAVRLKVEQNQLVDVFGEIGVGVDGLKGA